MKKAVVVISFGTSYMETRLKTISRCEEKIRQEFSDCDFYSAWTSKMIINKLKKRDSEHIYYPDELFEKLYLDGYNEVYIQSLHLICGEEYHKLLGIIEEFRNKFDRIVVGRPLLSTIEDHSRATDILEEISRKDIENDPMEDKSKVATVWMGHGSEHIANSSYVSLNYRLRRKGINSFVGTVEGHPEIEDVIYFLKKNKIEKIHLRPFLLVAGDHARNDMASDEDDSWKSILKANGFEVEAHIVGIGEYESIQNIFVSNLLDEVNELEPVEKSYKKDASESKGHFYGIGVGPGDESLLTTKAVETLKKIDVLYCPQAKSGGESTARNIASRFLKDDLTIKERHFPMNYNDSEKIKAWDRISDEICEDVSNGLEIGFITLGDPMIYSTYVYLLERVRGRIDISTIPGIPSFVNISSSTNFPLAMDKESMAVVSGTDSLEKISKVIDMFDSIVIMKANRRYKEIIDLLIEKNIDKNAIMVSNSSMESEKIHIDLNKAKEEDSMPYFTTIIVNKEYSLL